MAEDTATAPATAPGQNPTQQPPAAPTAGNWASAAAGQPQPPQGAPQGAQQGAPNAPPPTSTMTQDQRNAAAAGSTAPPVIMRPKRGGLLGVVDKIADALTGTTRPELYTDDKGNEFVYHPNLTRGQQWARIGATMLRGAGAGLAGGRGGNLGKAILGGVQVGQEAAQSDKNRENELSAKANTDMLNRANLTLTRMNVLEKTWANARLQVTADEADAKFADEKTKFLHDMGGEVIGTAAHPWDLADVLHVNPTLASDMIKDHTIEPVSSVDPTTHKLTVTFVKMPNSKWQNQMLPAGTTFNVWNSATNQMGEQKSAGPISAGEQMLYNDTAYNKKREYQNNITAENLKKAQTEKATAKATETKEMLPLRKKKEIADTSKSWAEAHKANIEAQNAQLNAGVQEGNTDSEAQALVDGRTAVSLMNKRAKNFNDALRRADEISMQKFGHPYDRQAGEINYRNRQSLLKDYTDGQEASSIESFDKFLGHAREASEAINDLRNKDSRWMNVPINKIERMTASKRGPELQAAMVKFQTLRNEFETTLKNNHALTVEDIKEGQKLLDENVSMAVGQDVMRSMAHVATVRLRSSDFKYSRTMRDHVPDLLSQQGTEALQHFGIDPKDAYSALQGAPNPGGGSPTIQLQPGEVPHINPTTHQQIVVRDGVWKDVQTGKPVQ